jgi:hypothetical protein
MGLSDYKVHFLHFIVPWDNDEFMYNTIFNLNFNKLNNSFKKVYKYLSLVF